MAESGGRDSHDAILARVRALTPRHPRRRGGGGGSAHGAAEMIDALLAAGISRILIPPRYGGYGLSLDTWFEVVREIAKADASHAWCASLMIHHPHYVEPIPGGGAECGLGGRHRFRHRGFDPAGRPR